MPALNAGAMEAAGLSVRDLVVGYDRQRVLERTCLDMRAGEYACLLGRSGSGKSTLLGAVAGFVEPTAGRIAIGDQVVWDAAAGIRVPSQRRQLGMVFQEPMLWPHLSVLDNILFPLRSRKRPADASQAEELLARVGLAGLGRRKPAALSGGQRQRVAICRALVAAPSLVLLDEPLSAVDSLTREQVRDYLQRLFADSGTTALHVTHDPAEAFALGRHVGVVDQGRLVQWGTPQELYRRPVSEVVAGLTGAYQAVDVPAEPLERGQARFWFDGREWTCPAHPQLRRGAARLLLRPESVRLSERAGHWRQQRQRFEGGSFHVELRNPRGERLHGRSARPPDDQAVSIELSADDCWLLPPAALAPSGPAHSPDGGHDP